MKESRWSIVFGALASGALLSGQLFSQTAPVPASAASAIRQLNLTQAEELLLRRNQVIAATRYQLEVTQSLRRIAGYKPNPILHLGAEQAPFHSPVRGSVPRLFSSNPDAGANPTYTAQFTKIIERGGKRELRIEQAEATIEASKAQILDAFRTQLFQLRQAFTNAILARENLRLAETIDQQYGETERLTILRVSSGDLAGVESYRVRAGRLPYRQAILDAQAAYQQATRDILNFLNIRSGEPASDAAATLPAVTLASTSQASGLPVSLENAVLVVEGELSDSPIVQSIGQLRERALRDRPDAMAARNALKAAERGVELAEAQRKRDVAVGIEYQRVGDDHTVGVTTEIPLFVYNNQKAAIAQAVAQKRIAEAQLRQVETQVLTDVEKAYQSYLTAQRALSIYSRDGMQEAARVRQIVSLSYRRGEASLFELLDAQRTASQAAVAANQARANYQLALWQIEQAIGGSLR
jgi:cobalt-zinc-cadmium efflux system outer membrane protein